MAEQRKAEELEARLREHEEEAISATCAPTDTYKCLVLLAWNELLAILMQTFIRNRIQYVRLEAGGKKEAIVSKFNDDPDIAAFFLHTKSQSAGLNLVAASYVFLVEPLLHPSLEVQAIARVHRIGQQNKTTVFQYAIMNSVDERVAHLRAVS